MKRILIVPLLRTPLTALLAISWLASGAAFASPVTVVANANELRQAVEGLGNASTIQIEEGIYGLTAPLVLKEGMHLRGVNKQRVVLQAGADINLLFMASGATLENLTVDGNHLGAGILLHGNVHDCVIRDVIVSSHATQGISLQKAYQNRIQDVTVIGNGHRGINLSDSSHDNLLRGIIGRNNIKADVLFGHGAHHNVLEHSCFEAAGNEGEACPNLWIHAGASSNIVLGITLRASDFQNAQERPGIVVWNSRHNIVSNIALEGYRHGILVRATTLDTPCSGVANEDTRDNIFSNVVIANRDKPGVCAIELHAPADPSWYVCDFSGTASDRRQVRGNLFTDVMIDGFADAIRGPHSTSDNEPGRIVDTVFRSVLARNVSNSSVAFPGVSYR